ncbi:MAG TPA: PKD domain-containing protein [Candidatus Limnocylindria bacterium]
MSRRALSLILLSALLLSLALPTAVAAADPPLPRSMAAVGDSITQAASTGGTLGADYPQNSWSTGTSSTVNSHYLRLLAASAPISGQNHNRSVSGAMMVDLDGQMANVVTLQPDYVTVLMGGNDLCTDTVAQMTSVTNFRSQFETAMNRLIGGTTTTVVYVVSIPDVYQLWNLFKNNFWARFIWSSADICQSLLANPTSTQAADVQRRAQVRQRNIDFNTQLAEVCMSYDRCLWDGNAVFGTAFTSSDVSGDYFHPSVTGQAKLAAVSWAAGYSWAATPPPNQPPSADFTFGCLELTCTFTDGSSDDAGIATRTWQFGDAAGSTATNPTHTYAAAGTYSVTLTVTDEESLSDSVTKSVTVASEPEPPPAEYVIVESLTSSSESTGKNTWRASVTVLVTGPDGRGVPDAVVTTTWSAGAGDTCTTGSLGTCTVLSDNLNKRKVGSVTLTVTDVSHATYEYIDPDPLPSVIVARPA